MTNSHLARTFQILSVIILEILCVGSASAQDPASYNLGWEGEQSGTEPGNLSY